MVDLITLLKQTSPTTPKPQSPKPLFFLAMASCIPHCTNSTRVLNKLGRNSSMSDAVLVAHLSQLEDTAIVIERGVGRAPGKDGV